MTENVAVILTITNHSLQKYGPTVMFN